MYFKAHYVIYELIVPNDTPLEYELSKPYPIKITITNPPREDLEKRSNFDRGFSYCDVFATREISEKLLKDFKKVEIQWINSNKEHIPLNQIKVTKNYKDYLQSIAEELGNTAIKLIGLIKWINNSLGPHGSFGEPGVSWSIDNDKWYHSPIKFMSFLTKHVKTLNLETDKKKTLVNYLNKGITEPGCYELFREAWDLRASDPRSSLVIGVASVEVGVKTVIIKLNPLSKWLMDEIQTPYIIKIIKNYLKELPEIKKINNNVIFPKSIIKTIQIMNDERNKIVHAGSRPPNSKDLENMLEDIRDFLHLLDYYCGFDFALSFIRPEKLQEIGLNLTAKNSKRD